MSQSIRTMALFMMAGVFAASGPASGQVEWERSRALGSAIHSGDVLFHSRLAYWGLPAFRGTGIGELVEYGKQPKQWMEYDSTVRFRFKDGLMRIDVEKEPDVWFPDPVLRSYIVNEPRLALHDHWLRLVSIRPCPDYRASHYGSLHPHPMWLGFDLDGVTDLVAKARNPRGTAPMIWTEEENGSTVVYGIYEKEPVALAVAEWRGDGSGLFARCAYKNPEFGDHIEIVTGPLISVNGIPYPEYSVIRQIEVPSLDVRTIAGGRVISEQTLTVLEAEFNPAGMTGEPFDLTAPEGYFLQNRETLRERYRESRR